MAPVGMFVGWGRQLRHHLEELCHRDPLTRVDRATRRHCCNPFMHPVTLRSLFAAPSGLSQEIVRKRLQDRDEPADTQVSPHENQWSQPWNPTFSSHLES
jgi:hypothetical protein